MTRLLGEKLKKLETLIDGYGSLAVAFSGGVDSTFLANVARNVLGDRAVAVTVESEAYPPGFIDEVRELAGLIGIRLIVVPARVTGIPGFAGNSPDRCYHCKKALFTRMLDRLRGENAAVLADGSNADDRNDFRPGTRALAELGVKSPLRELEFTKADIRSLSKEMGLPTWNRQSFACLASRIPYGTRITPDLLERAWKAEAVLKELGFGRYRVRHHGDVARIELEPSEMRLLVERPDARVRIVDGVKKAGFVYVTLDLEGYRTGSMNESLSFASVAGNGTERRPVRKRKSAPRDGRRRADRLSVAGKKEKERAR